MQTFTLGMLRHAAKKLLEGEPRRPYPGVAKTDRDARDWIASRLRELGLEGGKSHDREDLRRLLDHAWGVEGIRPRVPTGAWAPDGYKPTLLAAFDPRQPDEQAAFEAWVDKTRSSGDVDQVQQAWLRSDACAEFNDQRKEYIERMLGIPYGINPSTTSTWTDSIPLPSTTSTWTDSVPLPATSANTSTKETTMSNITVTTPTLVNGTDISKLSDSQVYEMIRQAENEIANLEAIKNKPARLKAEIEKLQAGIDALVAAMNARDAKA